MDVAVTNKSVISALDNKSRGKQPASRGGTSGGGKPVDNVPKAQADESMVLPLRLMATRETTV
jgi:hypothetical protein